MIAPETEAISLAPREFTAFDKATDLSLQTLCNGWASRRYQDKLKVGVCACCCPCIFLAHLKSQAKRENPIDFTTMVAFFGFNFGQAGMYVCFRTSFACILGWPFPPILTFHLFQQRKNLKIIYGLGSETERGRKGGRIYGLGSRTSCFSTCTELSAVCCLWPCILIQHHDFLHRKQLENSLKFDWEEEIIPDLFRPLPPQVHRRIIVVGPAKCGKSVFARRLVGAIGESSANELKSIAGCSSLTQIGVKCYSMSETSVTFVEVWDFSPEEMESYQFDLAVQSARAVAFLFDSSDTFGGSFLKMKNMHDEVVRRLGIVQKFCIATKIDLLQADVVDDAVSSFRGSVSEVSHFQNTSEENFSVARRQIILDEAQTWSRDNGAIYLEVSSQQNVGVIKALRKFVEG